MSDEQQQPEQEQQPKFPMTNFNIQPNGVIITTMLAPDLSITKFVDASFMHELCAKWREMEKQQKQELQLIQDIRGTNVRNIQQLIGKGRN